LTVKYLNDIISSMGILLISFYVFEKSIKRKTLFIEKIFLILWCLLWATLCAANLPWIPLPITIILFCVVSIIVVWKFFKIKIDTVISAFLLSFGISHSLYFIAGIPIGLIFSPFLGAEQYNYVPVDFNNPIYILYYSLVAFLQFIMARQLFKIKRFKNGFPFLFEKYAVIVALITAGIVVVIVSIFSSPRESYGNIDDFMLLGGIIISGIGIIIWIRRGITMFYKKRMKDRNNEELEQKLLEKDKEIQRLTELIGALQKSNHKFVHRVSAFENGIYKLIETIKSGKYFVEISEELDLKLNDIIRLRKNYDTDISQIKMEKPLPSTNINGIDDMFSYFSKKYSSNNISFNLKIDGSIPYFVENIIDQSDLETMIGDFLENALIAVNASDKTFRSVLAIIGVLENYYEFTVFDSGIPFEPDTLVWLGKERVTTHSDTGGSGIGFMTTFETMKKYGASLIIKEKTPNESDYTKSITVRFDGENRYMVESYRFGDIFRHEEQYTAI